MKIYALILILTFISLLSYSQSINGRIIDAKSGNPLAFVNIVFDKTFNGVSSDIDGKFEIKNIANIDSLYFNYVSYEKVVIATNTLKDKILLVKMSPQKYVLKEVSIFATENPAHRIILNCIANKKFNDPEKLNSFSYSAYHKMIFTGKSAAENQNDSIIGNKNNFFGFSSVSSKIQSDSLQRDTLNDKQLNIFKTQHLFIMESVSKRIFKAPDKHYEKVIATRISGLKDPLFVMLANQLQSFSFYKNSINIIDKQYVNPISPGSTKKYFFLIEDTLIQNKDTVFVISFRPKHRTNFDGMKGLLYINTNRYAIQSVIAEPADTNRAMGIRIQQKYGFIDSLAWFPVQLNTNLEFSNIEVNEEPLVGIGKSYISDIKINPKIRSRDFSNVVLDIDSKASKQSAQFWKLNRTFALDSMEMKTYNVMDSVGDAEHFDRKLKILRTLSSGNIPVGPIDIPLNKILNFNEFEGLRLGLGLQTNDRLLTWAQFKGYSAWTFGDKQWKYGGEFVFNIWRKQDATFTFRYKNDVYESAGQYDFSSYSFINNDAYRKVLVKKMVYFKNISARVKFRALPNSTWTLGLNYQKDNSPGNYQYVVENNNYLFVSKGDFNIFETHIGLRFAYREKIIRNRLYQISMGTKYPILNLHYTHALAGVYMSELAYDKIDMQIDFSYNIKYLGHSSWRIAAAKAIGQLPWYKLYNGKGSYLPFFVESPYSFSTMRINEFLSNEYLAIYFRHDFGSLLFGDKPFVPHPVLISNFTIGNLQNIDKHKNISFNTLEKGYYESGIMFNSILKNGIATVGLGIMYRYGAYSFSNIKNNFAYKLTIGFGI